MTARALLLTAVFALLALARPAAAQTVRGELVERGSGRPIPGALVLLLDAGGARVHAALTRADGRFTLRAPRAGAYTLRAERVGFRSVTSAPLALGVGQTVGYRLQGEEALVSLQVRHPGGVWRDRVMFHPLVARHDIRIPANVVRAPGESRR